MQGFGIPIYNNIKYPFKKKQPVVMAKPPKEYSSFEMRNSVGSYKREFDVPYDWMGKTLFIKFDGVKLAFYLWVNGEKAGYSQGSMTPATFDISKFVKAGKNSIAVEVSRWSDGSYLECQDMWRLSGIYRDVTLIAKNNTFIRDFLITIDFDIQLDEINANYKLSYTINSGGEVQVHADYKPSGNGNQLMPKFGFRVAIPKQYALIEWYGRGPQENYPDRKTGAFIGTYHSTLTNFITPYISRS